MEGKCLYFPHKYLFCKHAVGAKSGWIGQKGKFTGIRDLRECRNYRARATSKFQQ